MRFFPSLLVYLSCSALSQVCLVSGSSSNHLQVRQAEPTGRGACVQQGGNWVCELGESTPTPTSPALEAPSAAAAPAENEAATTGENCHYHGTELHCEEEESGSHEGHSHGHDSHEGHSHAGHSHGPSAEYGCGLAPLEDYNLGLHIAAIFILLAASFFGVLLPALGSTLEKKFAHSTETSASYAKAAHNITFALRHFGGGIILSTAFIHLLFHAFIYLSNECVGELNYEAASPAIAMGAIYLIFLIDFLALRPIRRQAQQMETNRAISEHNNNSNNREAKLDQESSLEENEIGTLSDGGYAENKLAKVNVLALEAGIIFHSIIIGVTIGTASGEGWVPLLIAIVFHQFCEGLGLSSRIALLPTTSTLSKLLMYGGFVVTTPIGIAIGIGVRRSYNGNDRGTLLAIGILDSISAGILLYSALVQIMVGDFINNKQMLWASKGRVIYALTCFTLGAIVMSVLGLWA